MKIVSSPPGLSGLLALAVLAAFSAAGCRCASSDAVEDGVIVFEEPKPSPEEPPPEKVAGETSCAKDPAFRPEVLRSSGRAAIDEELGESPYGLEFGVPSFGPDAVWVPVLRSGPRSARSVVRFDRSGRSLEVSLGSAHGDVGPARIAAALDRVVGVELESAARGRNARLFSIDAGTAGFELVRGPEFAHESLMDDSVSVALSKDGGAGVFVREASDGRLEALRLGFAQAGVGASKGAFEKARLGRLALSLPTDPALSSVLSRPELSAFESGFVLTFVRLAASASPDADSPEAALADVFGVPYVTVLDERGEVKSRPIALLTEPRSVLRITTGEREGNLEIMVQAPSGSGAPLYEVVTVGADGTIARRRLEHHDAVENVVFLEDPTTKTAAWCLGGGDRPLLRELRVGAPLVRELGMEPGDPVGAGWGAILAVTPRGLDLELGLYRCRAPSP